MKQFKIKLKDGTSLSIWGETYNEALEGVTISGHEVFAYEEYDEGSQIPEFLDNAAGS